MLIDLHPTTNPIIQGAPTFIVSLPVFAEDELAPLIGQDQAVQVIGATVVWPWLEEKR